MCVKTHLLAVGSNEERPDYDYTDGLALHLYQLSDASRACAGGARPTKVKPGLLPVRRIRHKN